MHADPTLYIPAQYTEYAPKLAGTINTKQFASLDLKIVP